MHEKINFLQLFNFIVSCSAIVISVISICKN